MTTTHVIIACSATKNEGPRAAAQKYASRQHNEALTGMLAWGYAAGYEFSILSAKHGVVRALTMVGNYDVAMSARLRDQFIADPAAKAQAEAQVGDAEQIVVYGGRLYRDVIKAWFPDREIIELVGEDRGCGDHFSALKSFFSTQE